MLQSQYLIHTHHKLLDTNVLKHTRRHGLKPSSPITATPFKPKYHPSLVLRNSLPDQSIGIGDEDDEHNGDVGSQALDDVDTSSVSSFWSSTSETSPSPPPPPPQQQQNTSASLSTPAVAEGAAVALTTTTTTANNITTNTTLTTPHTTEKTLKEKMHALIYKAASFLAAYKPPRYLWRTVAALVLGGEVMVRILQGKIHVKNTMDQLNLVGPRSLGVCLLTSAFVGMVFTIQFIREFAKLGLTRSVGGVLALALSRELTPVVTSIIVAGRVGSAFAAELGTMQVSEQTDSLRVLGSDPVDYLITPRVFACMVAGPILNLLCLSMGMAASVFLADAVYGVSANVILDSASRAIASWDIITSMIKCWVFGTIISVVSCAWGYTTSGGAKGVGESTTSAVVISLVLIFIADFALSFLFFQGQGDALKQCM